MLLLPADRLPGRHMLVAITTAAAAGLAVAVLMRLQMGLSPDVPLNAAAVILPLLSVPWIWHLRRLPGPAWAEATAYALAVVAAQHLMAVDVAPAVFIIPVIGVLHRSRRLTVYAALVAALALRSLIPTGSPSHWLQFGAYVVLLSALVVIYLALISLAERAERSLVHARMTEQIALQWAASIEARDRYTGGHVERVTQYAMALAPRVQGLEMDLDHFRLACVLHDVGKISVPDQILNKPGPLTPEEYRTMQAHARSGYDLVLKTNVPRSVALVVRHHHERWDGKGYPDGLVGGQVPMAARVLAVADTFDAITSDRPYRAARTPDEARSEILAASGTQFDPAVVAAFKSVYPLWNGLAKKSNVARDTKSPSSFR